MNGWNHDIPKWGEIRCLGKSEHILPHMWHPSRFTQNNVTVGEQTLQHMWHRSVKFVNKVCMATIEFPKSSLKFPWRMFLLQWSFREEYPCFNNFETRIETLNRMSSYFEKPRDNVSTVKQEQHMQRIPEYWYLIMENWLQGIQIHHACHRVVCKVYHPHQTPDEDQENLPILEHL